MTEQKAEPNPLYQPISHDELPQIRKELRERENTLANGTAEGWRDGKRIFAEHTHAIRLIAVNASIDYGKSFIKFVFLLNGGAMVALLALIGSIFGKSDGSTLNVVIQFAYQIKVAFYWYIAGLISAAGTTGVAYVNWTLVFRTYFNEGQTAASISSNDLFAGQDRDKILKEFDKFDRWSDRTVWIALILGIASLVAFLIGSILVASAFSVLGMT